MSHPHAPAEVLRAGYAVTFRSVYTGFRCHESITGARDGILRSTTRPVEIAFWPLAEDARAWLASVGFREGDAVPIGVGHLLAWVYPFAADQVDPVWDRGSLFEVPAGWKPAPAAVPPQKAEAELRSSRFRSLLRQARERRAAAKASGQLAAERDRLEVVIADPDTFSAAEVLRQQANVAELEPRPKATAKVQLSLF